MNRTHAVGLAAALAITSLAGWLLTASVSERRVPIVVDIAPKRLPTPEEVDADGLGELRAESCICARSEADGDCWSEYRERVSDFEVDSIAASCVPLSIENDCVMTTKGEVCWLTGFGESGVCTIEEAAAVEHAFNAAPAGKEYEAMAAVIVRIRKGDRIRAEPGEGFCT